MDDERDEADDKATARRRRVRLLWVTGTVGVVLVVAAAAGIWATARNDDKAASDPSSAATSVVAVSFDEHGMKALPGATSAGIVDFTFADRRAKPGTSVALLYYEVQPNLGGDLITGSGGSVRVLLCAHTWYLVVRVDGAVKARVPLDVTGTSPDCATPVT